MRLRSKQAGDTIVEVLIAMAVAAGVLASSYSVVNRTMANARQAQEHSEALEIASKQIEYIAVLAGTTGATDLYDNIPVYNCVGKDTGLLVPQPLLTTATLSNESKYVSACVTDGSVPYLTAFSYDMAAKHFTVSVTWASVTGHGNDQVKLVYKAYQR